VEANLAYMKGDRERRFVIKLWPACLIAGYLFAIPAWGSEVCRFAGTTDFDGQVAVTAIADTNPADGTTTVDVRLGFNGTPMLFVHTNYLMQEISTWKATRLQSLAVNSRYRVDGHVVRQLWDVFVRGNDGLEAYRLQARTPKEFLGKHPTFAEHANWAAFGHPWLQDYWRANPERRRDLDLPASSAVPGIRSPLALAFYWGERLPRTGEAATVFLPGFKKDKSVTLTITPAGPPSGGAQPWETSLRYPALSMTQASTAKAWVSADGRLLELAVQVRTRDYTARGVIRLEGCTATTDTPDRG
jgi:hypothetical protein